MNQDTREQMIASMREAWEKAPGDSSFCRYIGIIVAYSMEPTATIADAYETADKIFLEIRREEKEQRRNDK